MPPPRPTEKQQQSMTSDIHPWILDSLSRCGLEQVRGVAEEPTAEHDVRLPERLRQKAEFVHNCNYSIIKNLNSQHGPCFLIENVPKPRLFSEVIHAVWSQLMTLNANLAPLALVEQDFVKQEGGEL